MPIANDCSDDKQGTKLEYIFWARLEKKEDVIYFGLGIVHNNHSVRSSIEKNYI